MLCSSFPEDGASLLVLGDLNVHLDKHTLLVSKTSKCLQLPTNQVTTCTSSTHAAAPLLIHWLLHYTPQTTSTSILISTRLLTQHALPHFMVNLHSPAHPPAYPLWSHPPPSPHQFSSLDTKNATDTFFATLTSNILLRPARATPSAPWLTDVLREHRSRLRAAERRWRKSKDLGLYLQC